MEDFESGGIEKNGSEVIVIGRDPGVSSAVILAMRENKPELIEGAESFFSDIDPVKLYLETGKGDKNINYRSVLNHLNATNIATVPEKVVIRCILQNKESIQEILDLITPENFSKISLRIIDVIMTQFKDDDELLDRIQEDLRTKITQDNKDNLHRFVLDAANYGGSRGKFIRTFSPEAQERWIKLFNLYEKVRKSIGLTGRFL